MSNPMTDPTKLVASMGVMYAMNQLDFTDESTVNYTIAFYAALQALVFGTFAFVYLKVQGFERERAKEYDGKEQPTFVVKPPPLPFGAQNPEPDRVMTEVEYDYDKLKEMVKQQLIGVCICVFIFHKWESPRVLFLQAAMAPLTLGGHQLIKIWVYGHEATGDLKRPWAPPPGIFDELQKQQRLREEERNGGPSMKTKKEAKKENRKAFIEAQRSKMKST